jgi:hypothetical protein
MADDSVNPKVAPFESCIVCFAGDTTTGLILRGEAEWIAAALCKLGLPEEQAYQTFFYVAENELGCDPGMVPAGVVDVAFRVCAPSASRAGMEVAPLSGGELPGYVQREGVE